MKSDKTQKLSISVSIHSNFVNILKLKLNFGFVLIFADVYQLFSSLPSEIINK